jgi:hypothetical protein
MARGLAEAYPVARDALAEAPDLLEQPGLHQLDRRRRRLPTWRREMGRERGQGAVLPEPSETPAAPSFSDNTAATWTARNESRP